MEKKALGKGISALIPERESTGKEEKVSFLKLGQIRSSQFQPREDFDDQALEELAQSIREKGVIQPILVRRRGENFELIAGERRLRAANILQLKEIPAIIRDISDEDSLELALIENLQREELNSIEEARAYQYLMNKFKLTQERISEVLGKARVTVTNTLRLLKLPREIQDEMKKGRISYGHGRALLEIDDANKQRRLAQEVISRGLSVRELENLIKSFRLRPKQLKQSMRKRDPYLCVIEEELQHILATKVRINRRKKRGHITIEFYSQEDLDRVINKIRKG
ncbi:ParB/RepB/Spo0J family partition protein [Candidatus Omnitrophota bacterium]